MSEAILSEFKKWSASHDETQSKLQKQLDELYVRASDPGQPRAKQTKSITDLIRDDASFQDLVARSGGTARIPLPMDLKTAVTSAAVGTATSGVLNQQRAAGVVPEARRSLKLYQMFSKYAATATAVDYVKVNTFAKIVSPQVEAAAKAETELTFATVSVPIRTIATWIPATKQVLDDSNSLRAAIEGALVFSLQEEVEDQILAGDNTGVNLNGLTTQAAAFSTALLGSSFSRSDVIARAIQQIMASNEVEPNFVVMNPADWIAVTLEKDSQKQYIFGPPNQQRERSLHGLDVVVSSGMSAGYFLVGSTSSQAAAIFEREGISVEISTEHSDYFTKNMVAIRAETRLALVVFRPNAYVYGSLSASL
jgi:HK97 family phage major capsid protein